MYSSRSTWKKEDEITEQGGDVQQEVNTEVGDKITEEEAVVMPKVYEDWTAEVEEKS